jgi:predicted phosphodiesterase
MSEVSEVLKLESQLLDLKSAHTRTLRDLEKARVSKDDLVQAVYRAAKDASAALTVKPVTAPKADTRKRLEEVAVPLVSDLQLAKTTPDYNSKVCEERMELYADKIIKLSQIQRSDHPVRKAHVLLLGDIVEGALIFPGQQFLIDAGLYRQVAVDGPRILVNFLRKLLSEFEFVEVTAVIGNHGRLGRHGDHHPEDNADRMVYRIVQNLFATMGEKRIKFNIPDGLNERNWYAIAEVGKWKCLCLHGDQMRGHSGLPWYGFQKKINSWAAGAIHEEFDAVAMGHWHQIASIPLNKRTVFVNGSTESYNTWAQEQLAGMSDPAQWLLFVNPNEGNVTAQYQVRLG